MVRRLLCLLLALPSAVLAQTPSTAPGPPPAAAVQGRFVLPNRPVWAGEVFPLTLLWRVDWDLFRYLEGDLAWTAEPLVAEGLTRDPPAQPRQESGRHIADLSFTTRAMALQAGTLRLQPARQQMQIANGSYVTSGVTIATIGPVAATSAAATLTVRPLPPAPLGFTGAVGDFVLASTLDQPHTEVGRPVLWKVRLSGTGNWAALGGVPSRPLPRDFDMIGAPRQIEGRTPHLFKRAVTEEITIVPRKPGAFKLGPVQMTVFDPRAGLYRTIAAPPVTLDVQPGPGAPPAYEPEPDTTQPPVALPPALHGAGHAWAPLPSWAWRTLLTLPVAALGLLWLGLAGSRAHTHDPHRAARRAHARLSRTLTALANADAAPRRRLVRQWQQDARIRLNIGHAAPEARLFGDTEWARLWEEAERHLYGRDVPLPADWQARAQGTLRRQGTPPPFHLRSVFAPRHLYPALALLCALLVLTPAPLSAADRPRQADTRDWIGHYNLARRAADAKQWSLAAAQAGIAWVQHPRSAETRTLWVLAAREAGSGGRLAGGLPLADEATLAGALPPFGWQVATLAGMLLALSALAALLLRRFGHLPRSTLLPAAMAAALGMLGAAVGLIALKAYGPAAAADAAILWRQAPLRELPVDTPATEAAIQLAPGTAGHMGRPFMGWVHLTLADGRSGWLRRDELLPLWQAPP